MGFFAEMRRELNNPQRINASIRARKQLRGFHDFAGNNPRRLLRGRKFRWRLVCIARGGFRLTFVAIVKRRAGKHRELAIAGALILIAFFAQCDVAEQAGENRAVNRGVIGVALVQFETTQILQRTVKLRVQILPFAHSQIGKKVSFAEFPALTLRAESLPLVVNRVPDF